MVPRSVPKASLEVGQENDVRRIMKKHAFCDNLGNFGRHLGLSWAPRGPKIEHFGTRNHQKSEK